MNYNQAIIDINNFVKQFIYFEFSIYSYSENKLIIVGSPDLIYYHNIEIHLNEPFYISSKSNWIADTKNAVQELDEAELIEYNKKNKIEIGNNTFKFLDDDGLIFYYTFNDIEIYQKVVKY
jgi:hypothetical protein